MGTDHAAHLKKYDNLSLFCHMRFLVYRSQPVTPVKHAFLHFATLSAIDEYLRIKMFAFALVDYVKKEKKNWWLGRELNP